MRFDFLKKLLFLIFPILICSCSTKWVPDSQSPLNPPVAFQQEFIADAIDEVFYSMDFSRLSGQVVDIEVMGVYPDGDIAEYLRGKLQLELAKAGAQSEIAWTDYNPSYKANIMIRYGGVNDIVKSTLFYEWRVFRYTYDVEVNVFSMDGNDYFVQSGKGSTDVTVAKNLNILFFPIPLRSEWSTKKNISPFDQYRDTYNSGKRIYEDPSLYRKQ